MDTLFQNLREISPTYFGSVPRIWEKLASTVDLRMDDSTWVKRTLYRWAVGVGRRYARVKYQPGGALASGSRSRYASAYWLVLAHSSAGSASTGPGSPSAARRRPRPSSSSSTTPSASR